MTARQWLNYHHLYYFKMIATEGGIARAAKKLRLGQPTLSTQLRQFEDALGQPLFERKHRQLELTEIGRVVLGYANDIFRLGDEMLMAIQSQHSSERIHVQIGAMDTVSKHLVLQVIHKAQAVHNCLVTVHEGHGDELLRELRAHRIDLVMSNHRPPVTEGASFYAKSIARMPVAIFGAKEFAPLRRNFPESLANQPFVMPSWQSRLRHDVAHYLTLRQIPVNIRAEVQDSSLQRLMGAQGDGLIPATLNSVEDLVARKELQNIGTLDDVYEDLWLVAAHRRLTNPVAAAIMRDFAV